MVSSLFFLVIPMPPAGRTAPHPTAQTGRKRHTRRRDAVANTVISFFLAAQWKWSSAPCAPAASGQAVHVPLPPAAQGVSTVGARPVVAADGRDLCNGRRNAPEDVPCPRPATTPASRTACPPRCTTTACGRATDCRESPAACRAPPPPARSTTGRTWRRRPRRREITIGEALHPADVMPEGRQEIPRRGPFRPRLQKQQEDDRRKQAGGLAERLR